MIPQNVLDEFSNSVAAEVAAETGMLVGHIAKYDPVGKRYIFTFKVGLDKYSYPAVKASDMHAANSFQGIFDALVKQVLTDTSPETLLKKKQMLGAGIPIVDVAPVIDQQGKRHFRMKAETGLITSILN